MLQLQPQPWHGFCWGSPPALSARSFCGYCDGVQICEMNECRIQSSERFMITEVFVDIEWKLYSRLLCCGAFLKIYYFIAFSLYSSTFTWFEKEFYFPTLRTPSRRLFLRELKGLSSNNISTTSETNCWQVCETAIELLYLLMHAGIVDNWISPS